MFEVLNIRKLIDKGGKKIDDNTPEIDISDILTKAFRIRSYVA